MTSTSFWVVATASLLAAIVGLLLYQVLTGAITRTIAAEVAGQDLDIEQSYRFGFARLGPILVVSILVGLATLLGLVVFIIPGIYIGVRLAVSVQALVVEGRRGTDAMRRSWELVGGHWWHAAFTVLLAGLLTSVVNAVITAPFGAGAWFVQAVAAAAATTVTLPYGALVGVLLYLDLRTRSERLDLDTLKTDLQTCRLIQQHRSAVGPGSLRGGAAVGRDAEVHTAVLEVRVEFQSCLSGRAGTGDRRLGGAARAGLDRGGRGPGPRGGGALA